MPCKNLMRIFLNTYCGGLVLVRCPRCGTEVSASSKEWDYNVFHVKRFDCKKCDKAFMAYFREGKLSHTIPKPV
jgi:transposase-like protein